MKKILSVICWIFTFSALLSHPGTGILQTKKGEIIYTDLSNVWKMSQDGVRKSVIVPHVHTHELAMDQEGNVYGEHLWYNGDRTNTWGHYVWKYDYNGIFTKIIPDREGFRENYSFTQDGKNNMYWIERGRSDNYLMQKSHDGDMKICTTLSGVDIRHQYVSRTGFFYYIDDNDLYKINLYGDLKPMLISSDLDGKHGIDPQRKPNNNTMGIWDDPEGNIYVAVLAKKEVVKISPAGSKEIIYTSQMGYSPSGGLIDSTGNLWVLENNAANQLRVKKVLKKNFRQSAFFSFVYPFQYLIVINSGFLILVLLFITIVERKKLNTIQV